MNKVKDGLKYCPKCDKHKNEDQFYVEKGKYLSHNCKECLRKAGVERNKNKSKEQILKEKEIYKIYYEKNRERYKESSKRYREDFPELNKNSKLKGSFGINFEEYNKMLIKQDGKCKTCGRKPDVIDPRTGKIKSLCIDHCHTTGKIRGLLCNKCNSILGYCNDSEEILKNLLKYLEDSKK